MTTVVWLTDDRAIQPAIEAAVALIPGSLIIIDQPSALPAPRVDVILWKDEHLAEATYQALLLRCMQLITLVARGQRQDRLGPLRSEGAPRYYVVVPFDPEELAAIVQCSLQQAARNR